MRKRSAVRKAVFPVAGLGTRFLPATKAIPKELLPVVDRPLIQYAVHEALAAGCDHIILVIHPDKGAIVDHFTRDPALEARLAASGKDALLEALKGVLPAGATVQVAYQDQALGLGHAVLCARERVGDDPAFAVVLPDDMVRNDGPGALAQLTATHRVTGASVIGVEEIDPALSERYGIAAVTEDGEGRLRVRRLVEKPPPAEAPSRLGIVGRYVLESAIFRHLEGLGRGAGGEIQLTDAIAAMLADRTVYAQPLVGKRYDCGNTLGMLCANIDYAMARDELRDGLLAHLAGRGEGRRR